MIDTTQVVQCKQLNPDTDAVLRDYDCTPQTTEAVLITNACSTGCPASTTFKIQLSGIRNAPFNKPELTSQDSFQIETLTSNTQHKANCIEEGIAAAPALVEGTLQVKTSSRSELKVSQSTVWSFVIVLETQLPLQNKLKITLPAKILYSSDRSLVCRTTSVKTCVSTAQSEPDGGLATIVIDEICDSISKCESR